MQTPVVQVAPTFQDDADEYSDMTMVSTAKKDFF